MSFRTGVVAVLGRPNVGKSTLVNAVVGQKVSIVSDKAQTTRRRTVGVATTKDWQIVFIDTPGVHAPQHRLGKALNETAKQSVQDVDVLLVMVDVSKPPNKDDESLAKMLHESEALKRESSVLCLNKMDLLKAEDVQRQYELYHKLFPAGADMMTSLTKGQNLNELVALIVERLPEGEPLYDAETVTDQPMRLFAAELVREKILHATREEVPHAVATYVEEWEEDEDLARISIVVMVEREGQKGIIIGKKGAMLGQVGKAAREEIELALGKKVFLKLFVKVSEDWRQSPRILQELEYH